MQKIQLLSDASAAIGIASRRGSGKVRHIEVSQLWLQDRVLSGSIEVTKIGTVNNLADALTKHVDSEILGKRMQGLGVKIESGRHSIMPEVAEQVREYAHDPEEEGEN